MVQLIIVGYVLKYIFGVNHSILTLLMVLFICFNAAYNAQKRSKYIDKAFLSSFIAITVGAGLTLSVLVLSGSAKTVGLVSLPGMMSGLIFAGIDPVKAIKYQIMVTFMLLSTASLSTIIACYLTYRKFYNSRHQLVVTHLKKT